MFSHPPPLAPPSFSHSPRALPQNMFLAIINDTYSEVKAEIANQRNDFEIADYFKRGYNNMLGKLGKRDKLLDVENALKLSDANSDGQLTFDEIRVNLKKYIIVRNLRNVLEISVFLLPVFKILFLFPVFTVISFSQFLVIS